MKKKILTLCSLILIIFTSFALSGCDFGNWFKPDLKAPTIVLNKTEKTLSWQYVSHAEKFEVYCNNELSNTLVSVAGTNTYSFENLINDETTVYNFYVVATGEGYNNSDKSNVVTYLSSDEEHNIVSGMEISNSNLNLISNLSVNSNILTWNKVDGASNYYVLMYSNGLGENIFETTQNAFNFEEYVSADEIIMFRVGIKNDDNEIALSLPKYYNSNNLEPTYNKNIYYFHGELNDYYITSQEELNHIVYYAFIYKLDSIDVCLSQDYLNELILNAGTTQNYKHLTSAVQTACASFTESCYYDTSLNVLDSKPREVEITFSYVGSKTPENTTNAVRTQNELDTPYYEKVNYEKRDASYNDFASDKQLILEYVETSEQLYHTVESGATPIFKSENSDAYILYNQAKDVLREIISDEMTEYEKVLSIFDYICYNTVYDDELVSMPDDSEPVFITYGSFFLEGVFEYGIAVCDGFSKSFSLLCNMEGIDAVRITGTVSGGLHAWNKVKVYGNWYVVDITWTVTQTNDGDFTTGGEAVNFNSKEFLSYKYFLVSDSFISNTHYPANAEYSNSFPAVNDYYYYSNATYDGVNNYIISSDEEFENLVNYMLENKQFSVEVAFSSDYFANPTLNPTLHNSQSSAASKRVKTACGIPNANILFVGCTYKAVGQNEMGSIYSLTLINLPDVFTSDVAA